MMYMKNKFDYKGESCLPQTGLRGDWNLPRDWVIPLLFRNGKQQNAETL